MGPDLQNISKKSFKSAVFWGGKSLDMGKGFRPRAAHPVKK